MFGFFFKQLHHQPHSLETYSIKQQRCYLADIRQEARLLGVLNRPTNDTEVRRYYRSLTVRYNRLLNQLHHKANTEGTIVELRRLVKQIRASSTERVLRKQTKQCKHLFEYLTTVRRLEQQIVDYYLQAIDIFQTENQKFRDSYNLPPEFYQVPAPLTTRFSHL